MFQVESPDKKVDSQSVGLKMNSELNSKGSEIESEVVSDLDSRFAEFAIFVDCVVAFCTNESEVTGSDKDCDD